MIKRILLVFSMLLIHTSIQAEYSFDGRVIYESAEEAVAQVFKGKIKDYLPKKQNLKKYQKIETLTKEVHRVLVQKTGLDLPLPLILLSKNKFDNRVACKEKGHLHRSTTNAILISNRSISKLNQAELVGLISHEMSHYFFDHGRLDEKKPVKSFLYDSQKQRQCLYQFHKNNYTNNLSNAEDLVSNFSNIGSLILGEEQLLPLGASMSSTVQIRLLDEMVKQTKNDQSYQCQKTRLNYRKILSFIESRFDRDNFVTNLTSTSRKKLLKYQKDFITSAKICFKNKFKELDESFGNIYPITMTSMASFSKDVPYETLSAFQKVIRDAESRMDPMQTLLDLFEVKKEERKIIMGTKGSNKVNILTTEDQADIMAANIIHERGLGKKGASYLLRMIPFHKRYACKKMIKKGVIPEYGELEFRHHGTCWRYYQTIKQLEFLESIDPR